MAPDYGDKFHNFFTMIAKVEWLPKILSIKKARRIIESCGLFSITNFD